MPDNIELVIVALAAEDDVVQQYSSDKAPHLTLLYLGTPNYTPAEMQHVIDYVGHAASQITGFGLEVERRGELGPQHADVLFFYKKWSNRIADFRGHLLQDETINRAYQAAPQFPEWTPHLTMGFPDNPAKKDTREYQRYSYVRFDRIAIWTGDSVGPTFELKSDYGLEVAMPHAERGADIAAEILHYGVKGMRWGQHKRTGSAVPDGDTRVTLTKKNRLVGEGGKKIPPHHDAIDKVHVQTAAKGSGLHAISNKDLQAAITRMNLEQQFVRLTPQSKSQKAKKFVAETLLGVGKQQVTQAANNAASQQVAAALARAKK